MMYDDDQDFFHYLLEMSENYLLTRLFLTLVRNHHYRDALNINAEINWKVDSKKYLRFFILCFVTRRPSIKWQNNIFNVVDTNNDGFGHLSRLIKQSTKFYKFLTLIMTINNDTSVVQWRHNITSHILINYKLE